MSALVERAGPLSQGLLRVSLGVMFLAHSVVLKLYTFGLAGTAGYFESIGLPGALAYVVFAAEAAGGLLLIANVATGWVSLALLPVLAGAFWVHSGNGWVFSANGGGWEYPLFLIVVTLTVGLQAFAVRAASRTVPRAFESSLQRA
jgi:putative oxidoreductase